MQESTKQKPGFDFYFNIIFYISVKKVSWVQDFCKVWICPQCINSASVHAGDFAVRKRSFPCMGGCCPVRQRRLAHRSLAVSPSGILQGPPRHKHCTLFWNVIMPLFHLFIVLHIGNEYSNQRIKYPYSTYKI